MRICHNQSCPNSNCPQTGRTYEDLQKVTHWAREHIDNPFALGVLATVNYLLFLDYKTPEERFADPEGIIKADNTKEWIKMYVVNAGLPEIIEA